MKTKRVSLLIAGAVCISTLFAGVAQADDEDATSGAVISVVMTMKDGADAKSAAAKAGVKLKKSFDSIGAASFDATADQIAALSSDPSVEAVSVDGFVSVADTQYNPAWHLDRLDQQLLPLDNSYTYADTGTGITVYVADTGVRATHEQFGGRVVAGFDSIGDGLGTDDCNGHGTFVSALAGGSYYGVAKSVTIVPVRVLGCDGTGTWSQFIAGLDFVAAHHAAGVPAVLNLSLSGDANAAADLAVQRVLDDGVVVTAAAGNAAADACNYSPARVPGVLTVGATNSGDAYSTFSNFGSCVDLFAPGEGVSSAYIRSNSDAVVMSGTSMSSPLVAGAAALAFARDRRASASSVVAGLMNWATPNVVTGVPQGTPNWMVFIPAGNVKLSTSLWTTTTRRK